MGYSGETSQKRAFDVGGGRGTGAYIIVEEEEHRSVGRITKIAEEGGEAFVKAKACVMAGGDLGQGTDRSGQQVGLLGRGGRRGGGGERGSGKQFLCSLHRTVAPQTAVFQAMMIIRNSNACSNSSLHC